MKIGFIGLGKLGKDAAEVMSEKYYVEGYDITQIRTDYFTVVNTLEDVCKDKDIIFVAVPTPHDPLYDGKEPTSHLEPKDFDYSIVKDILFKLNEYTNKNQLVVLISTVLPGTIRREFVPIIKNYRFIYNPYLIAMGTVKYDMVYPEMVIIGTKDGSHTSDAKILKDFYITLTDKDTRYEIGTWDEAEAIKIFYNTFISTKVALVNMIQDVSERLGNIDVDIVTGALERSTKRIVSTKYMKAGMGDGGSCHPRDNIALRLLAKNLNLGYDLFDSIMVAREKQSENLADKLIDLHNKHKLPIVILGKSYKPKVDIIDGSTSYLTGHYLNKKGYDFTFDKNIGPAIYLISHRDEYNEFLFHDGSVIVDMWREFKTSNGELTVIKYGNTRKQNILNFVYDVWDKETGEALPNASTIYNDKWKFWMSEGLIQHYLNETKIDNKFTIKRCELSEVYERKNENFYYFIGNAGVDLKSMISEKIPFSDLVIKCVKECENFFIVFRSEHESETEGGFKKLIEILKEHNIKEKQIYLINNNDKLNDYKIKYHSDINVHTLSFLSNSSTIVLNLIGECDFVENKTGKFFMSFNKSPKQHRCVLLVYLLYHNIIDEFNWSFVPDYKLNLDFNFYNTILSEKEISEFKNEIDYLNNLKIKISDYEQDKNWFSLDNPLNTDGLPPWMRVPEFAYNYLNSYVNITTESHFLDWTNTIHITEKSFKPFYFYQYPLILSTHGHIKKMKEKYGFDFFDDIINHSYDDEPNGSIRIKKFVNEIIRINDNKTFFIDFYKKNKLRFEENKNKVLNNLNCETDYLFFKNLI